MKLQICAEGYIMCQVGFNPILLVAIIKGVPPMVGVGAEEAFAITGHCHYRRANGGQGNACA